MGFAIVVIFLIFYKLRANVRIMIDTAKFLRFFVQSSPASGKRASGKSSGKVPHLFNLTSIKFECKVGIDRITTLIHLSFTIICTINL